MAIYIMRKFDKPMGHYGDTFYQRLCHLVCEDVGMALYICVLIFALFGIFLGWPGEIPLPHAVNLHTVSWSKFPSRSLGYSFSLVE